MTTFNMAYNRVFCDVERKQTGQKAAITMHTVCNMLPRYNDSTPPNFTDWAFTTYCHIQARLRSVVMVGAATPAAGETKEIKAVTLFLPFKKKKSDEGMFFKYYEYRKKKLSRKDKNDAVKTFFYMYTHALA